MSDLQRTLPPRVPPPNPDRFTDSEVLFTTLVLMCGEPPTPPIIHGTEGARMKYAHEMKHYGYEVKKWMEEFGHNPHIGLFTEYIHWCSMHWDRSPAPNRKFEQLSCPRRQPYNRCKGDRP